MRMARNFVSRAQVRQQRDETVAIFRTMGEQLGRWIASITLPEPAPHDEPIEPPSPRDIMSRSEAAEMLGLSVSTLKRLVQAGKVSQLSLGRRCMVRRDEVERLAREGTGRRRRSSTSR